MLFLLFKKLISHISQVVTGPYLIHSVQQGNLTRSQFLEGITEKEEVTFLTKVDFI